MKAETQVTKNEKKTNGYHIGICALMLIVTGIMIYAVKFSILKMNEGLKHPIYTKVDIDNTQINGKDVAVLSDNSINVTRREWRTNGIIDTNKQLFLDLPDDSFAFVRLRLMRGDEAMLDTYFTVYKGFDYSKKKKKIMILFADPVVPLMGVQGQDIVLADTASTVTDVVWKVNDVQVGLGKVLKHHFSSPGTYLISADRTARGQKNQPKPYKSEISIVPPGPISERHKEHVLLAFLEQCIKSTQFPPYFDSGGIYETFFNKLPIPCTILNTKTNTIASKTFKDFALGDINSSRSINKIVSVRINNKSPNSKYVDSLTIKCY